MSLQIRGEFIRKISVSPHSVTSAGCKLLPYMFKWACDFSCLHRTTLLEICLSQRRKGELFLQDIYQRLKYEPRYFHEECQWKKLKQDAHLSLRPWLYFPADVTSCIKCIKWGAFWIVLCSLILFLQNRHLGFGQKSPWQEWYLVGWTSFWRECFLC